MLVTLYKKEMASQEAIVVVSLLIKSVKLGKCYSTQFKILEEIELISISLSWISFLKDGFEITLLKPIFFVKEEEKICTLSQW